MLAFCTYSLQQMPYIDRIQMSGQDLYVITAHAKYQKRLMRRSISGRVDAPFQDFWLTFAASALCVPHSVTQVLIERQGLRRFDDNFTRRESFLC
jgi:hypothetical protein